MSDKLQDAWARVTVQLAEAGARIEALTEGRDPVERAEGYRFLTRVLSAMIDFSIEADGERPAFVRVMTPTRKFYGDCPDPMYHRATLRSGVGYRISGQRGGCIYLAFCVYGLRGKRNAILANVSDAELVLEPDGSFEIILSAERPEGAANWLRPRWWRVSTSPTGQRKRRRGSTSSRWSRSARRPRRSRTRWRIGCAHWANP